MTEALILEFGAIPSGPNDRLGWYKKSRQTKEFRTGAGLQTRSWRNEHGGISYERIRLSATFSRVTGRAPDPDNEIARLKPIIDGIVDGGLIPDDTAKHLILGDIVSVRGPRGLRVYIAEAEG